MSRIAYILSFILVTTLMGNALAEDKALSAEVAPKSTALPLKIGVLDWQALKTKSPQAEKAMKRLEKEFKGRKEGIEEKQKAFETKYEKFQRDKEVMAEAERVKAERELNRMQQEMRGLQEEFQSDVMARQREEMEKFLAIVNEVVEKFSKQNSYDAIFTQEVTLYSSDKVDVTPAILEKLKQEKQGQ